MLPWFKLFNGFLGLLKPLVPLRCGCFVLWPNDRVASNFWKRFQVGGLSVHCKGSECEVNNSMGGDVNVLLECRISVE